MEITTKFLGIIIIFNLKSIHCLKTDTMCLVEVLCVVSVSCSGPAHGERPGAVWYHSQLHDGPLEDCHRGFWVHDPLRPADWGRPCRREGGEECVCVGLFMQGADYTDRKAKPQSFRRSENISLPCVTDASNDHIMILLHSRLNQCGVIHLIKLHIPKMLSLWIVSNIYTVLFQI